MLFVYACAVKWCGVWQSASYCAACIHMINPIKLNLSLNGLEDAYMRKYTIYIYIVESHQWLIKKGLKGLLFVRLVFRIWINLFDMYIGCAWWCDIKTILCNAIKSYHCPVKDAIYECDIHAPFIFNRWISLQHFACIYKMMWKSMLLGWIKYMYLNI